METKRCEVCGNLAPDHPQARLCRRCKKIVDRVEPRRIKHNDEARILALKEAWDGEGFRCYYTGVRLVEDKQFEHDALYLTLDHRIPNREDGIVVAALLINRMKTNLTEDEFKAVVSELSSHFGGRAFDANVFKLSQWKEP